jgi:hypothetical protein
MKRRIAPGLLLCGLGIAGPVGCMGSHPDPLDSRIFVIPQTASASDSSAGSAAVAVPAGDRIVPQPNPLMEMPKTAAVLPDTPAPTPPPFNTIKPLDELASAPTTQPAVSQTSEIAPVHSTGPTEPAAAAQPTAFPSGRASAPATQPTGAGQGVYQLLGGVLAEVNETPIYTSQVLAPLKTMFARRARELSPREFQMFATQEIYERLQLMIEDEREFGDAYHSLTEEDRNITEAEAMMIRHDRVVAAGGSVAEARRLAAESGEDFDESVRQEYRKLVFQSYTHRQFSPLILVSPDGMRDYYNQNSAKFCQKAQVQFRVIEIDPAKRKSAADARELAAQLRDKAAKGCDFTELAKTENDDEDLKKNGGSATGGWMDKGAFLVAAVDSAVWELQPGQITPVVESDGKLYVAKLEAKRDAVIRRFEDPAVQAEIYESMYQMQFGTLLHQARTASIAQSMLSFDPRKRIGLAVEIAMQDYARVQAEMQAEPTAKPPEAASAPASADH